MVDQFDDMQMVRILKENLEKCIELCFSRARIIAYYRILQWENYRKLCFNQCTDIDYPLGSPAYFRH